MTKVDLIWSAKSALTQGVQKIENAEVNPDGYAYYTPKGSWGRYQLAPRDWFYTREGAIERAEQLRQRRLTALRNAIHKLEIKQLY